MATLLFQAAGTALGGLFGPVGALVGRAAGALAGNALDRALINGGKTVPGARLSTARIPGADDGTAITRLYGTARIGGTLIWATRFVEEASVERTGSKAAGNRVETFRYYGNFAVGLCEGPIAHIRRVFADGREIDLTRVEMRVHTGTQTQMPDPLIEAKQGVGMAPAYRGLAYVVFEHLPLDTFGNRIPVLQFEVLRPVGTLEQSIRAVTLIPGASEHGYATVAVTETTGAGSARTLNRNVLSRTTDWEASVDEMVAVLPNLRRVALVVSWFGTDLRAGACRIVPGVETAVRQDESTPWSVAGLSRAQAHAVSLSGGGPAYGGTPDDTSVIQAIGDLKARGLEVFFYPFLMMDIASGNGLADPYGGAEQSAYPWRGRITCHPAVGQAGSTDRTASAGVQVGRFLGEAGIADFTVEDTRVSYHGADEGYRRMVLHYALLAQAAGGVDGFIIGSELPGLTTVRDNSGSFPFVAGLVALASDVRAILGPAAKLTYGADWSEYFGYHPDDGSGDVYFHLDPLWASPAITAVGIDNYMPLADWRDADLVTTNPDGMRLCDDPDPLMAAITAGEGMDWYYASDTDRANRNRLPISDGLANKPWVFRTKDIAGWWGNRHYERVGGAERATPTAWVPGMKPVWLTELGCPAVDKGANQPNVFSDPKSSETAYPHFSSGARADSMQRRFLEAHHRWWQGEAVPAGVVDPDHVFVWTWDARPHPAFPDDRTLWSDGGNWRTGHWLDGRMGAGTLADVIAAVLTDHGFTGFDVAQVSGDLTGYIQGDVTSARSLLEPLMQTFQIDAIEDGGVLRFRSRGYARLPLHRPDALVDTDNTPLWSENRGHDSDYASEAVVGFDNPVLDYERASARAKRGANGGDRILDVSLPAVIDPETAGAAVENLLRDHRMSRRTLTLSLSPADIAVQPGDVLELEDGPQGRFLVARIEDGAQRTIEAREHQPVSSVPVPAMTAPARTGAAGAANAFAPLVEWLDLPRFEDGASESFARGAVFTRPWRPVALSSSATEDGYAPRVRLDRPARIGTLAAPLAPGLSGRFDWRSVLEIDLAFGALSSSARISVLNGANRIAVRALNGTWEVIGFLEADETSGGHFRLSGLLRGLGGTIDAMMAGAADRATVVVLDAAVRPLGLASGEAGLALDWIAEPLTGTRGHFGPRTFAGGIRAETPLAPVHVRARRMATGMVVFSWTRCGRIDADSWDGRDIPLDEPDERYRLEIFSGDSVLRRVEVAAASFAYAQDDEIADFGTPQTGFHISLCQLGRRVPLGVAANVFISL